MGVTRRQRAYWRKNLIVTVKFTGKAETAFNAELRINTAGSRVSDPEYVLSEGGVLFTAAKVTHLGVLPQGQAERGPRVLAMVAQMEAEGFGGCTNHGECESACPKGIKLEFIARLNRDYLKAAIGGREAAQQRTVRR